MPQCLVAGGGLGAPLDALGTMSSCTTTSFCPSAGPSRGSGGGSSSRRVLARANTNRQTLQPDLLPLLLELLLLLLFLVMVISVALILVLRLRTRMGLRLGLGLGYVPRLSGDSAGVRIRRHVGLGQAFRPRPRVRPGRVVLRILVVRLSALWLQMMWVDGLLR